MIDLHEPWTFLVFRGRRPDQYLLWQDRANKTRTALLGKMVKCTPTNRGLVASQILKLVGLDLDVRQVKHEFTTGPLTFLSFAYQDWLGFMSAQTYAINASHMVSVEDCDPDARDWASQTWERYITKHQQLSQLSLNQREGKSDDQS